jgi:sialate O-acetylesterase
MVLQAAPSSAVVWGFCDVSETTVDVSVVSSDGSIAINIPATISLYFNRTSWMAKLPPTVSSFAPSNVTATASSGQSATLEDVLFGDVFVCGGQSNMVYPLANCYANTTCYDPNTTCTADSTLPQCTYGCVNNSFAEIEDMAAGKYPHIRLLQVRPAEPPDNGVPNATAEIPYATKSAAGRAWMRPSDPVHADGLHQLRAAGGLFSATCWFYGRDLFARLNSTDQARPIGLIESAVGGTPIEHWMAPSALDKCKGPDKAWQWPDTFTDSGLWNDHISPLLRTSIRGAVWYQGESNQGRDGRQYACAFKALIEDWREQWHRATEGGTAADFPFGWAQLNSVGSDQGNYVGKHATVTGNCSGNPWWCKDNNNGYSSVRWAQDLTLRAVSNTFQAVILDTPVANGCVHSPFKQPVGARLARQALRAVYGGVGGVGGVDPRIESAKVVVAADSGFAGITPGLGFAAGRSVHLTLSGIGAHGVVVNSNASGAGFEVLTESDGMWHAAPAAVVGPATLALSLAGLPNGTDALVAVRYLWYPSPCGMQPFGCPVYARTEAPMDGLTGERVGMLPAPPFISAL